MHVRYAAVDGVSDGNPRRYLIVQLLATRPRTNLHLSQRYAGVDADPRRYPSPIAGIDDNHMYSSTCNTRASKTQVTPIARGVQVLLRVLRCLTVISIQVYLLA
jgi:hypothetical protein